MKIIADISEKDWMFMQKTYKEAGLTFVPEAIKNECVNAVYNGTPYEERKSDEWCTGCKEYDTEKHCCPRFNRVIRETLNETSKPKGKWIFCGYATERDWELGIKSFKCSVCDKKGDWKSPCCPHCGVKMEVEI